MVPAAGGRRWSGVIGGPAMAAVAGAVDVVAAGDAQRPSAVMWLPRAVEDRAARGTVALPPPPPI
jgi:hypothetical protein